MRSFAACCLAVAVGPLAAAAASIDQLAWPSGRWVAEPGDAH